MNLHIPHLLAETFSVTLNEQLASAMNNWRFSQSPIPSPEEAIRRLLTIALTHEGVALNAIQMPTAANSEAAAVNRLVAKFEGILSNRR